MEEIRPNILKYAALFACVYILMHVVLTVIIANTDFKSSIGLNLGLVFGASLIVSDKFIKALRRTYTTKEKLTITGLSTIVAALITVFQPFVAASTIMGTVFFENPMHFAKLYFSRFDNTNMLISLFIAIAVDCFALFVSYGHFANVRYAALSKKGLLQSYDQKQI